MDEKTRRELAELKELRYHLQRQQELPAKIKSMKDGLDRSASAWQRNIEAQAKKQAQNEMTYEMPAMKETDHSKKVSDEIQRKISEEWSRKESVHTAIMATVRVIAVIVAILIVVGIHWHMGLQVFSEDFNPEYMSLMKMIPDIESDDAFDAETFTMLAIGQFVVIAALNSILCFVLNAAGGEK